MGPHASTRAVGSDRGLYVLEPDGGRNSGPEVPPRIHDDALRALIGEIGRSPGPGFNA